jgi:crossover junction endodeoxyribonuclease RuvC
MKVLGIDPGSHRTGWGVIEVQGSRILHLGSGTIVARGAILADRLVSIAQDLEFVLARFAPQAVAIENVFHAKNSHSALMLGQARGVALVVAARSGAGVHEYSPTQIKQDLTGRGRADKEQVQKMVHMILGSIDGLSLDASDALAAAICHSEFATSRVSQATSLVTRS